MTLEQLYEGPYLRILWDENSKIIGIDWKETTAAMTNEEFKAVLMLFATHVEFKRALGILVDVIKFRHKVQPEVQEWRVKNISTRYAAAGVRRFAFLLPTGMRIPPTMSQSAPEEQFLTGAFDNFDKAWNWLAEASNHGTD